MSGTSWGDLLKQGRARLSAAGIENASEDARSLLLRTTNVDPVTLITSPEQDAPREAAETYRSALTRRESREPMQHIVGKESFYGLDFKVDGRALIPRPDSEGVARLAHGLLDGKNTEIIADLGTGTGALLGALLHVFPDIRGIGVERSRSALELARENFASLGFAPRAEFFHGSWTEWTGWERCDLILSNPPYIRSDVIPTLEPEVRDHDPVEALDGGPDGLTAYREIMSLGAAQMKPGAFLVLEIGYDQKETVTELLETAGFIELYHQKDLGGNDRAIAAKHP